jgi:hypothetical protein
MACTPLGVRNPVMMLAFRHCEIREVIRDEISFCGFPNRTVDVKAQRKVNG